MREAARAALDMAARLYMGLNLARCVTLHTSPLNLGRALTWHIRFIKPAWHCGLALTIMLAFIPRAAHCFINLRRSLTLRAPHLTPHKRIILLTLAALRLLGTQTWDMAACVAARNLYRPEPWLWHPSTPVDRKDTKR
jgi:hypothetical protein